MSRWNLLGSYFFTSLGLMFLLLVPFVVPASVFADTGMDCMMITCQSKLGQPDLPDCVGSCCQNASGGDQSKLESCCASAFGTGNDAYYMCAKILCRGTAEGNKSCNDQCIIIPLQGGCSGSGPNGTGTCLKKADCVGCKCGFYGSNPGDCYCW